MGSFESLAEVGSLTFSEGKNVAEVGGSWFHVSLVWQNNGSLTKTASFPALESAAGAFCWFNNDSLVEIGDFPLLQSVSEPGIIMTGNNALETVGSFDALATSGGIDVISNAKLASLPNSPALKTLGKLIISGNDELTSIDGLTTLESVERDFIVRDNPKLPLCGVLALLDQLDESPGGDVVTSGNDESDLSCLE